MSWPPPSAASATTWTAATAEAVREAAVHAAALANGVLEATGNLSAVHIVGQVRLVAVDLMRAAGQPRRESQESVRGAFEEVAGG